MAKNKKPKGRAAAKQKAKKGAGGTPSSGGGRPSAAAMHARRSIEQLWDNDDDDDDDDLGTSFRGFTQANNGMPSRSRLFASPRGPPVKLRHQTIAFVSGGSNTPVEFQPRPKVEVEVEVEVGDGSEQEEDEELFDPEDNDDDDVLDESIQTNIVVDADMEVSKIALAGMHINGGARQEQQHSYTDVQMADLNHPTPPATNTPAEPLFVIDTMGDASLADGWKASGKRPVRRDVSPSGSDSSEEVVVFHGRHAPAKTQPAINQGNALNPSTPSFTPVTTPPVQTESRNGTAQTPPTHHSPPEQATHVTDDLLEALQKPASSQQQRGPSPSTSTSSRHAPIDLSAKGWANRPSTMAEGVNPDAKWAPAPAGSWWKKGKKRPDLDLAASAVASIESTPRSAPRVAFAEPQAEQTIETLQADWKSVLKEKQAAKKTNFVEEDVITLDSRSSSSKRRGKRGRKMDNRALRNPIVEDDDDDYDGEAAYDDYMANLAAQLDGADDGENGLSQFGQGPSLGGSSMFVDGEEIGDDEVLRKSHFEMMNADDGSSSASDEVIGEDLSELDSSGLEDDLNYTEQEQWEDEEDLRQRRREQMTDEQIARMFAKQQEFGYDGDDLIIDNGEYTSSDQQVDGVGDVASARAGLENITNEAYSVDKNGIRRRQAQERDASGLDYGESGFRIKRRARDTFPSASALADSVDQYGDNGFDIMDFDRPSLRPTKRGRKGNMPPEIDGLSDDELRDTIADSWASDRKKKSLKKAEREAQRAEGLLTGSGKKGKADLSVKYAFGISMDQIHAELRVFLLDGGQTSRGFPPMDKKDRKALHEVANVLNLKSKSIGGGNSRFPTLYKTTRTPYSPEMVDRALQLSLNGQLSRSKKFGNSLKKKNTAVLNGRAGQGGGTAAATVRNGEIVGAGAKEIGVESKGHRLMMKMGWAQGQALGKDGEGIMTPVEQKIRIGTAGLG